jgi:hypothetical protein
VILWFEWRFIKAWVSALGGALAAAATVYLVWVQLHPDDGDRGWELTAIIVSGGIAMVSAFIRPLRVYATHRFDSKREKVAVALRGLAWSVNEATGGQIPVQPLGASAYLVGGFPGYRWLYRLEHQRVYDTPGPTVGIRWTKGKGIIGQCWETAREMCVDSDRYDQDHGGLTEAEWMALDATTRRKMKHSEYIKMRGKYGTVVCVPMFLGERVLGVVALDAPPGFHDLLKRPDIREKVAGAAGVIGHLLT